MAFAFVQSKTGTTTSGATVSVTLDAPVGGGNALYVIVTWGAPTPLAFVSVTTDKGDTFTLKDSAGSSVNDQSVAMAVLGNATAGSQVVTATLTQLFSFRGIYVSEYSGVAALADPTDGHSISAEQVSITTPNGLSSGNITTTDACLIVAGNADVDNRSMAAAPGTGFTSDLSSTSIISVCIEHMVQTAAGTVAGTFTGVSSARNFSQVVAFKPASGGSTTVNLTGASVTASAGTATIQVSDSITITGATVSALAGAASPSISDSVTISGASCSGLAGTVLETISKPLSGAAAAALAGIVTPQVSDSTSISGATVTASAGLLLGTVAAVPSGAAASALTGAVGHGVLVAITGAQASALAGTVVAGSGTSAVISGASVSALSGAVGIVEQVGISGAAAVALAGAVTTTTGSGTTVNIAGAAVSAIAGTATHQTAVGPVGASVAALAGGLGKIIAAAMSGAAAAAVTGIVASSILSFPGGAQATALAGPVSVASSTTIGLQGANVDAVAGPVSTRIIETKLNPNYIALGAPRIMVAAGAPRSRIVVGINNQMAETNTLIPAIDADVEIETVTFDFGLLIVPGVTLTGEPTLTCEVFSGTDPDPSSRIIGDWDVGISPNTGQPNAAVFQRFGQMLGGVIYRLQCVMQTTDGQDLSLWTHLGCQTPN